MRTSWLRNFIGAAGLAACASVGTAQTTEAAKRPACEGPTGYESRARLFLASFGTAGPSPGLRTMQRGLEEQVLLAFYQIERVPKDIAAGRTDEDTGIRTIEGAKEVIQNYIEDHGRDALYLATTGQAAALPTIVGYLGPLLSVGRQDALLGREELAMQAQQVLLNTLSTFSEQFAATCETQTFPLELAVALERQNEMLGTGISVLHCARRKASADINAQGVNYHLETCAAVDSDGIWQLTISGRVAGKGTASGTRWRADVLYQGYPNKPTGDVRVVSEEVQLPEEAPIVPDDAGPDSRPNNCPEAPVPAAKPGPKKKKLLKLRMTTIVLVGDRGFYGFTGPRESWAEGEIKLSENPCN